jgi:hypothetical protein
MPRSSRRVPHRSRTRQGFSEQDVALLKREMALLERERDLLRAALDAAAAREQVALEREAWLRHQLEQVLAQNQRLLEPPRASPPAEASRTLPRPPAPAMALPATCSASSTTCASTPGRSGRKTWHVLGCEACGQCTGFCQPHGG